MQQAQQQYFEEEQAMKAKTLYAPVHYNFPLHTTSCYPSAISFILEKTMSFLFIN